MNILVCGNYVNYYVGKGFEIMDMKKCAAIPLNMHFYPHAFF